MEGGAGKESMEDQGSKMLMSVESIIYVYISPLLKKRHFMCYKALIFLPSKKQRGS